MKITISKLFGSILLIWISSNSVAQVPNIQDVADDYVVGLTKDLNQYMDHYMNPLLKGLGYGFNNGWYNTAKPHKSFGFDLTISGNLAYVPTLDQSFKFIPDNYEVLDLTGDPAMDDNFPTIVGSTTTNEVRSYLVKGEPLSPYVEGPILDGLGDELPIDKVAVPSPIIQLGVGIYKGTEIKIRWVPTIQGVEGLDYKYFGMGFMHNVSQWIPVVKEMKFLDISAFVGFTNIDLTYTLDTGVIAGSNQAANFGVNTITYELVGSATVSVITGYVGIGFDSFKTHLNMNGNYDIKIPGTDTGSGEIVQTITDPVALNAKDGGFRATVGARLKLAIFTLHAAYTFQGYNTLNAGIGFSFR